MRRTTKKAFLFFIVLKLTPVAAMASGEASENDGAFDWEPVMRAVIQVESEGNARAVSGNSVGAMQITPVLVEECNNILKSQNKRKRYKLADRFSVEKSKEMFRLIQSRHNPTNSVEKAIRSWNGGLRYSLRRTQRYYEKVMRHLKA